MTDWETAGINCIRAAQEALRGVKATAAFDNSVNPHTDADLVSHKAMVASLESSGLACDLVSEEFDQTIKINGGGNTKVYIDPIDGTVHFVRNELYFCAVGMIVVENGLPSYAFVGDLVTGDIYHCNGSAAFRNGGPVKIPGKPIGKPILAGWAPYEPGMDRFAVFSKALPQKEYLMFNFGQMLQSAKITEGRYDACFEIMPAKTQEFAGAVIAWRAGAIFTTMDGKPIVWDGSRQTMLVSRDAELHNKLIKSFNS
ncbi:MAG: hypothetical protein MUD10_05685 [Candidatus Pacebacteria bacterium]|jgi:fructose-1,6-bisphosphatase/inositol monophosphatase family enzyme|nr:hypothetical protein [Candidatus Paceibacterota bacterium]